MGDRWGIPRSVGTAALATGYYRGFYSAGAALLSAGDGVKWLAHKIGKHYRCAAHT